MIQFAVCLMVAGAVMLTWAGTASAHAFLVTTNPVVGTRLTVTPPLVTLQFSESVSLANSRITLTVLGKGSALPLTLKGSGATIRANMPVTESGIYEVSWQVSSSDDGHVTEGSFAFAVGSVAGSIPGAATQSPAPNAVLVVANWIFFIGLALAAGGLVTSRLVDRSVTSRSATIRVGFLVAIGGSLIAAIDSLGYGTSGAPPRVTDLAFAAAALLAMAQAATLLPIGPSLPFALVLAAATSWAGLGHGAARDGTIGWAVAAVHLMAVTVWLGALFQLILHVYRARRAGEEVWPMARRYARVALWSVVLLSASGLYLAIKLLPTASSLWSSSYGRLLILKGVLLALALCLALMSQRYGIGRKLLGFLRGATRLEAGILAAILIASSLLVEAGPPATAISVANLLGASPLSGPSLQQAGLAGSLTVGIAASANQIQIQVYTGTSQEAGTVITARARLANRRTWQSLVLGDCGSGCSSGRLVLPTGASLVSISTTAPGWIGGTYTTTLDWPPAPLDTGLLTQLIATMRAVPSLQLIERTSSGRYHTAPKTFTLTGSQFLATEEYAASGSGPDAGSTSAEGVRPLPNGPRGLSFDLGQGHLWVTIWLDSNGRISTERLINAGNEIDRVFFYDGAP